MPRIYKRNGDYFNCLKCGNRFYRSPGQIKAGSIKHCSKTCMAQDHFGKNNPFWGRSHSADTRLRISMSRKGKSTGNKHALGYRHTEEARKRIAEASKKLWAEERQKMLDCLPRGENHRYHKPPTERRHRLQFTPRQRREWASDSCAYCDTTEFLELDHIIPIFDGGTNARENAQTLCRGCNLWKTEHVDLPRYYAARSNGARFNPEYTSPGPNS